LQFEENASLKDEVKNPEEKANMRQKPEKELDKTKYKKD
jgi:hypothetical protein